MVYTYELPNITNGLDQAIIGIATIVPSFIPLTLLFVYCIVLIGGSIAQSNKLGVADLPMWSTIAGMATLMIVLPMSFIAGVINPVILTIVILLPILSGVWFFLDNNRNEV